MIFVSFYTDDEIYKMLGENLIEHLSELNLKYDIIKLNLHQSFTKEFWNNIVAYKPFFIKEMLEKHKESIVWIDVDTIIKKFPTFLVEMNNNSIVDISYDIRGKEQKPWLAIMFVKFDQKMIDFFQEFGTNCRNDLKENKNNKKWYEVDQPSLSKMMKQGIFDERDINFQEFPKGVIAKLKGDEKTVFVEIQSSREYRIKLGWDPKKMGWNNLV